MLQQLDSFEEKERRLRSEKVTDQLKSPTDRINEIKRDVCKLSDKEAVVKLQECLEIQEMVTSNFDNLRTKCSASKHPPVKYVPMKYKGWTEEVETSVSFAFNTSIFAKRDFISDSSESGPRQLKRRRWDSD